MEYARVEGGAVIERREIADMPAHKAALWKPVVYQGDGPLSYVTVEADRVLVTRAHPPLSEVKATYVAHVKSDAAAIRDRVRTPGKDLVYAEKKDQAHAVISMGQEAANALPDNGAATFPLLAGTVGIEAPTLFELAQLVWSKYEAWNALAFHIERAEASAVKAIGDASDAAGVRAAYEAIIWPAA